jgi:integrase
MARGRARYQRGRVVATKGGGWEIHYNVYLTDPTTGKPKRHHRSRVVGYKPKMHRADAEKILAAELATINGGPVTRVADGTITFGNWMRNFYIPMRGANWRDATRRTNLDYLTSHVYPTLEHVPLKDITKFQVQMLLNRLAAEEYSYTVVYHVRDLIKAGLAEAVDQEVVERNVARKTVIPEIEESEKPVLPVEMYAKLLAGLDGIRDRAIFLIACFCALRPSELFGLTWGCYGGSVFTIVNTAGVAGCNERKLSARTATDAPITASLRSHKQCARRSTCGGRGVRTRVPMPSCSQGCKRVRESHWQRRFIQTIGCASVCTRSRKDWRSHFTLRFRCSAGVSPPMARRKHTPPRCRPNSDTAIFAPP